jgi:hypothetical protein
MKITGSCVTERGIWHFREVEPHEFPGEPSREQLNDWYRFFPTIGIHESWAEAKTFMLGKPL